MRLGHAPQREPRAQQFWVPDTEAPGLPLTSIVLGAPVFRVTVEPTAGNGLRAVSQIMVDKLVTLRRDRVSLAVGELNADVMLRVSRALMLWLGIAA